MRLRTQWMWALLAAGCDDGAGTARQGVADVSAAADAADAAVGAVDAGSACTDTDPLRRVFFGDLHVHTAWSFDAWVFDVRNRPDDAYRFARGEAVRLPPLGADGQGLTEVRLDRPLDFAAVTDHAEFLAEVDACTTADNPAYDSLTCVNYRQALPSSIVQFGLPLTQARPARFRDVCGADGVDCADRVGDVWARVRAAAAAAQDPSPDCRFTSFVAYEYSGATGLSNLHRNVIFANDVVPAAPVSYFEEPTSDGLFRRLEADCLDRADGCDVIAIPHNGNWSNGNLFALTWLGAESVDAERAAAARRARLEPLVEVMQHKGDSECHPAFADALGAPDEACAFEKLRPAPRADCGEGTGSGAMVGQGCLSRYDFLRGALGRGLAEWRRLGINPFEVGVIASTDTHNGTPGAVSEADWKGHWGNNDDSAEQRLGRGSLTPGGVLFNPGGLAAVWAEENSRAALFAALKRREVYGTSGPRIAVRLFGGYDWPEGLCDDARLVAKGYAGGVPMGGRLGPAPPAAAPGFVLSALRDAGTEARPGAALERLQIVKGWVDTEGRLGERVYDLAGGRVDEGGVDSATCTPAPGGADALCAVWRDPDFDPAVPAFYYARVLEVPTCRWSAWTCLGLRGDSRPEVCDDPTFRRTQRERAWTSPIWYLPPNG